MTEITTLDKELLTLQQELSAFKTLQPRLAEVRVEVDRCVKQCQESAKSLADAAQQAIATAATETAGQYADLTTSSREQFHELSAAWRSQMVVSDQIAQTVAGTCKHMEQLASEFSTVAAHLQSVAKAIADVNFPVRLERVDATISASLATVQGLQNRFDALKTDLQQIERTLQLEFQSSVNKSTEVLGATLAQLDAKIDSVLPAFEVAGNQIIAYEASRFDALDQAISAAHNAMAARQNKTTKTVILSAAVLVFLILVAIALGIAGLSK